MKTTVRLKLEKELIRLRMYLSSITPKKIKESNIDLGLLESYYERIPYNKIRYYIRKLSVCVSNNGDMKKTELIISVLIDMINKELTKQ